MVWAGAAPAPTARRLPRFSLGFRVGVAAAALAFAVLDSRVFAAEILGKVMPVTTTAEARIFE